MAQHGMVDQRQALVTYILKFYVLAFIGMPDVQLTMYSYHPLHSHSLQTFCSYVSLIYRHSNWPIACCDIGCW